MITKPMLAGTLKNLSDVKYPVLCTPKLDGIRCLKIKGEAVSRNFKQIPNTYVRSWIEKNLPDGVDGELIVEGQTFQATTSAVMRESGEPKVVYYVFDYVGSAADSNPDGPLDFPYGGRMNQLKRLVDENPELREFCKSVLPVVINNETELLEFETKCLADGYEGVMIRTPGGPYKCGRSTVKEGYLLKLKRMSDVEAEIIDVEERLHNANPATTDAFGRTERSSHKANMTSTGALGALRVKSKEFTKEYKVGTGFTEAQRVKLWKVRDSLKGKIIKVKYQPMGVLDAPRFPTFIGFRHENDMGD